MKEEELEFGSEVKTALRTLIETCERFADKLEAEERKRAQKEEAGAWKPQYGETYYYVNQSGFVGSTNNTNTGYDKRASELGNYFQTELGARRHAAKMKFMFRRCPEIGDGEFYFRFNAGSEDVESVRNVLASIWRRDMSSGFAFKTKAEAEEWLPLYKFAFLGGDCPENF